MVERRPFADLDRSAHLRAVESGDFDPPTRLRPTLPRALEGICLKAMALRPVDRYATARAMAEDLERWLADRPTLAYPEPWPARLARWSRRHRTAIVGAGLLLACATAGLAAYAAMTRRENARVSVAWRSAEGDLSLALGAIARMLDAVAGADLAYLANTEPIRLAQAEAVLGFYRDLLARHPADARVHSALGHALRVAANIGRLSGQHDRSARFYAEAIALLTPIAARAPADDGVRVEIIQTLIDAGENLRMFGKPRAAEGEYLKALEALKRPGNTPGGLDEGTRLEAMARIDLAQARIETGRPAEARADADRAADLLVKAADDPRAGAIDRLLMAHARATQGVALRDAGEPGPASERLTDAARRARELVAARRDVDSLFTLAMVQVERGRLLAESGRPALSTYDEALRLAADLSNQHSEIKFLRREAGVAYDGRGAALLAAGRLIEARRDCDQARVLFEGLARPFSGVYDYRTQLGRATANLARIALARGKPSEARDLFGKAIARHQEALMLNSESPDDHKFREICRAELGRIESAPATGPTPP